MVPLNHVEPVSSGHIIATSKSETAPTSTIRNSPQKSTNPSITLKNDLARSSSSSSSLESVKSKPDSVYGKTTVDSHPSTKNQISIKTDVLINEIQEYNIYEISPTIQSYEPTYKMELKVKELITRQGEVLMLNIGGSKFQTTNSTVREDPLSLLAALPTAYPLSNEIFIDRDPKHLHFILNSLRNGCQISKINLPKDHRDIKELQLECVFFSVDNLIHVLEPQVKAGVFLLLHCTLIPVANSGPKKVMYQRTDVIP